MIPQPSLFKISRYKRRDPEKRVNKNVQMSALCHSAMLQDYHSPYSNDVQTGFRCGKVVPHPTGYVNLLIEDFVGFVNGASSSCGAHIITCRLFKARRVKVVITEIKSYIYCYFSRCP